ncbi:hypothetical protein [Streptomyces flavidovirens]|uniref:Integral membrane protein n=1 Tax=Streptomyces flavidovirens TaxID=67298 RepID=A0ABW6RKE9_9ACTN
MADQPVRPDAGGQEPQGTPRKAAVAAWIGSTGEMFSARVRMSGMAIGTQVGFAAAGFAVASAAGIASPEGWLGLRGWEGVGIFTAILCAISAAAIATARETYQVPTEELGTKRRTPGRREEKDPTSVPA